MDKLQKIRKEVARIQLYTQSEVLKQVLDYIDEVQKEPVKIKKGCKYRCLSDMVNKDTGNIAFIGDKIYLAPKDNTLVSEENGWLCDTSENASNFELVEEPVSRTPADIESAMQEVEEKSRAFTDAHHGEDADTILAQMRGEEPISKDLEKASKEWLIPQLDKSYANYGEAKMMELTHFDGYAMLDAIEFGARWQKEKDESITEDLGEYINELSKQFPEVSFAKLSRIAVRVAKWKEQQFEKNRLAACDKQTDEEAEIERDFVMSIIEKEHRQPTFDDAIKYGIRLQKEQMMAKAIDAHCFGFQGSALFSFRLPADNYLVGSEVKVNVIKGE